MPVTDTPLRYPGGKSQLAPFVIEVLRANKLFYGSYVEPFAGGCGIAWTLLLNRYVTEIHINDIDRSIHAFWASVLKDTDALCERIRKTQVTIDEWHRQREVQKSSRPKRLDLGFSTLFLNRTNRSGILKGGVIGGLNQSGTYKLDCRFNRDDLTSKIERIALHKDKVHLHRMDAEQFIRLELPNVERDALVNIDPPYYRAGPELYTKFYNHEDHVSLAKAVGEIKQRWMVTYDDSPEIRKIYKKYPMQTQELTYYAQVKRKGVELLILDPKLKLPQDQVAA